MSLTRPIVFLDFDGVVETIYWERAEDGTWSMNIHKSNPQGLNNKQAIGWLNELYRRVPYDIVVTSTWRYYYTRDALQDLLVKSGFNPAIKVVGTTPILHQQRGLEIQAWLDDTKFSGDFIIVDDDCDMCHLLDHLVRCDCQLGFTIYDYDKALRMLGGENCDH